MYWMMVKGPFEYITGFYKENIFKIRWSYNRVSNESVDPTREQAERPR